MRPVLTDELLDLIGEEYLRNVSNRNRFATFEQFVEYWINYINKWGSINV